MIRRALPADANAIAQVHISSWQDVYRDLMPAQFLSGLQATLARREAHWARSLASGEDRCRLPGRHRRQASSHIWIAGCQVDRLRLSGRHRRQLPQFDCGAPTLNLPLEPSGPEALRCQRSNVSL